MNLHQYLLPRGGCYSPEARPFIIVLRTFSPGIPKTPGGSTGMEKLWEDQLRLTSTTHIIRQTALCETALLIY